jgi:hypothetical protein
MWGDRTDARVRRGALSSSPPTVPSVRTSLCGSRDVTQRQLDGSLPPPSRELTSRTRAMGVLLGQLWSDDDPLPPFLGDIFLAHAVTLVVTP